MELRIQIVAVLVTAILLFGILELIPATRSIRSAGATLVSVASPPSARASACLRV